MAKIPFLEHLLLLEASARGERNLSLFRAAVRNTKESMGCVDRIPQGLSNQLLFLHSFPSWTSDGSKGRISSLQHIENMADKIPFFTHQSVHDTPLFESLHSLTLKCHKLNLFLLTVKALHSPDSVKDHVYYYILPACPPVIKVSMVLLLLLLGIFAHCRYVAHPHHTCWSGHHHLHIKVPFKITLLQGQPEMRW